VYSNNNNSNNNINNNNEDDNVNLSNITQVRVCLACRPPGHPASCAAFGFLSLALHPGGRCSAVAMAMAGPIQEHWQLAYARMHMHLHTHPYT